MVKDYSVEVFEPGGDVTVFPGDGVGVIEVAVDPITVVEVVVEGPQGPAGPAGATYVHTQSTPASTWNISHGLNTVPAVVWMLDSTPGEPVWVDYTVVDLNNISVSWNSAESGKAYLK